MMIRTCLMTFFILTSLMITGVASAQAVFIGSSSTDPTATDAITINTGVETSLYIWVDPNTAGQTVTGFGLNVSSDTPGLTANTSTVFNPANPVVGPTSTRWSNPVANGSLNANGFLVELQNAVAISGPTGISQFLADLGALGGTVVNGNVLLSSFSLTANTTGTFGLTLSEPASDPFIGDSVAPVFSGLTVNVIPEPASLALLGLGGLALLARRRA